MSQFGISAKAALAGLVGLGLSVSCSASETSNWGGDEGKPTTGGSSSAVDGGTSGLSRSVSSSTGGSLSVFNGGIDADGGAGDEPGATIGDSLNACSPQADDTGCVGAAYEAESVSLDIMVMFDLSCSMSCTVNQSGCCSLLGGNAPDTWRIQPVRSAMRTFLQDPASAGIGVGLAFFGDDPLLSFMDANVCSVARYSNATVEIAPLPDNAAALVSALDAGVPEGGTPTHLAIDGACVHAADWKTSHPGHKVVILLVTDGVPEVFCGATIQLAVTSATNCYNGGQGTETYVLGISANNNGQGSSLTQLNQIATAGGTQQAYLTDTTDVAASVLAALNAIRADAVIPCDLAIPKPPAGQTIDADKVNIGICSSGAQPVITPYVRSATDCGDNPGWYYNDPNSPTMIHLCNATCHTMTERGSSLFFSVGCATKDSTLLL